MDHIEIKIEGMTCGGCVTSVQKALNSREGVSDAVATLDTGMVAIDFDSAVIKQVELEGAIEDAGFDVAK
jgi:copper chaperone